MQKIILLLIIISVQACAQQPPEIIADRIEFCNSSFDRGLTPRLTKEFEELENHFIKGGLLPNNSGSSYYSVYKSIAKDDDLNFSSDYSSALIDSIEFNVLSKCFYLLLSSNELQELTQRHYEASKKIYEPISGNVSPGMIAQRIIDHLTEEDFDLKFYKLSSLLTFYKIATPTGINLLPTGNGSDKSIDQWLSIKLDDDDIITLSSRAITIDLLRTELLNFLGNETTGKAVEITASRDASYEMYIKLLDTVNERFNIIRSLDANNKFGKNYDDLNDIQKESIDEKIPRNIRINEPK